MENLDLFKWKSSTKIWIKLLTFYILLFLSGFQVVAQNNYQLTSVNGTFTAISGGTAVTAIQTNYAMSGAINLGFTFNYNGLNYSQVVVSSDGILSFNLSASSTYSIDLTNSTNRPLLAPLWGSSVRGANGTAKYITTGSAPNRVFTFEWLNWQWGGSNSISFQVKLYETSNQIEYVYRQESGALSYASGVIGMAFQNGGVGNFLSLSDAGASPTISTTVENQNIGTKPATGQIYRFNYTIDAEPANYPSNFIASSSAVNFSINWADATGSQLPDGYLVLASLSNTFTNPSDGTDITIDNDLSDGTGAVKVPQGIQAYSSWINFKGSTTYYFKVFPYTNNGIYINYKTNASPPVSQTLSPLYTKDIFLSMVRGADTYSTSWADFNKDGLMDIIVGNAIYTNNGDNTFSLNTGINQYSGFTMENNNALWGDYDNDEDLDLLMTYGWNDFYVHIKYKTELYKNGVNNALSTPAVNLPGLAYASVKWADLNNDGHIDFIIAGNQETQVINEYIIATTKLYYSVNDTAYTDSGISMKGGQNVSVADYNNDNYPDLLISGTDINSIRHTTLYKNNGDKTFTEQKNIVFPGLSKSESAWGDYNNDGNLDLIVSGMDDTGQDITRIYKNNGNNSFTWQSNISLAGVSGGMVAWGDYNNDGFTDILIAGLHNICRMYKNNGNESFTEVLSQTDYMQKGSQAWGDYDNDGDLDLILMGSLSKNNSIATNTKPSVPLNLIQTRIDQNTVKLSWDRATDAQTPSLGLSYNVRVGTAPGKSDVVSPLSDASTGYRRFVGIGNAYLNKEFILNNLKPGQTYYWSVQTVDNAYQASGFSPEQSFTVIRDFSVATVLYLANRNSAAWGDYDNDNDLDLVVGDNIFKNGGSNNFQKQYTFHSDVNTPVNWGDYNNDGNLDYIEAKGIFKNNGDGAFSEQSGITLKSLIEGASVWGDYDNDGDLDVLITGKANTGSNPISVIYKNAGNNIFTEQTSIILKGSNAAAWGDYDKDGNLDILIGPMIYKNNGNNTFTEQTDISLLGGSSVSWGDYDGDGDLDILLTGSDSFFNPLTNIYRNDGNNIFTLIETDIRKVNGQAFWGDYNNDGLMDILISGKSGSEIARVYLNKGNNSFVENFNFDGPHYETLVGWGDYNNDGNLDFFQSAMMHNRPQDEPSFDIYKNNIGSQNQLPGIVTNLENELLGFKMKLSWNKATDPNFTQGNLYYNLRLGTTPGGFDVISPMSDLNSGFRKIPAIGNAQCNTISYMNNLVPGETYYWSVQAIDQGFAGGPWAAEKTFVMPYLSAGFTADTVCDGSAVSFKDLSLSPEEQITSWLWDFGDGGGTSNLQNPKYTFGAAGIYNVKLTVRSASYSHSITKLVLVKAAPKASFSAPNVCMGKPMLITNTSQTANVNNLTWNWSFGDKTADFKGQNPPPHNYLVDSAYLVKLFIKADNGCADSTIKEVIIGKIPSNILSTSGETTFCVGNKFVMTAQKYPNFTYEWRKDNTPLLDKKSNVFEAIESGIYKVNITNLLGNCSVTSSEFTIVANPVPVKPVISAAENPAVYCEGSILKISTSNIANTSYQWLKNNTPITGETTNSINAFQTGLYRLKVSNNFSCSDTSIVVDLTINPKPAVSSVLSITGATTFCEGNNVLLEAEYNPEYIYKWKKDGNFISTDKNIFTANQSGNYIAEVSTNKNCNTSTNPVTVTVNVSPAIPVINNEKSYEICQGENIDLKVSSASGQSYQWYLNGGALAQATTPVYKAGQQGKYTLAAVGSNLCTTFSKDTISLKVLSMPVSSTIQLSGLPNICPGQPIDLSVEEIFGLNYQWLKNGVAISGAVKSTYTASGAGNYAVKIQNKICSITSPLQPITEKVGPPVPEMYLKGDKVWYIGCSVKSGVTYTWYKNDIELPNSNSQIIVPGKPVEGIYYVQLKNGSECPSRSVEVRIPDDFKSGKFKNLEIIPKYILQQEKTLVYPNPSKGIFKLSIENEYVGKVFIQINDLTGKTIMHYYVDKTKSFYLEEMDLSKFGKGVYFVEIIYNDKKENIKIVIE